MPTLGKTAARGYGSAHQRLRKEWAPRVATGTVTCWRCGRLIEPGQAWDLGHDDTDRTIIRGPEHAGPNRAAGNRSPRRGRRRRAILTAPAAILRQPPTAARW